MKTVSAFCVLVVAAMLAGPSLAGPESDTPETVSFVAADGFWIHADYYGPVSEGRESPMVMVLHADSGARSAWEPLIRPLRDADWVVLVLDLRGYGESATSETGAQLREDDPELFRDMQNDLHGAYDWLAKQKGVDRARFALVAAGGTAGVATRYAVDDRSVDAVVCLSPVADSPGLDTSGDLGQLPGRRILLLAGEDEADACDKLAERARGAETRVCKSTASGTKLLADDGKAGKDVASFLTSAVGKPVGTTVYGSKRSNIYHAAGSGWIAEISPSNLRYYSSPKEAESRGLRKSKSSGPRDKRSRPDRGDGRSRSKP